MSHNQKFQNELHFLYEFDPKFITKLLEYHIPVPLDAKDKDGNTLLHKMITNRDFKSIDLLLQNLKSGVYSNETKTFILNSKNNSGNAPIHMAVIEGLQLVAKQLHKVGADISVPNSNDLVVSLTESDNEPEMNDTNLFSRLFGTSNPKKETKVNRPSVHSNARSNFREELYSKNFILDTITSSESQRNDNSSESVDTNVFIEFLRNKQLVEQNGGKQKEYNSIKGKRSIHNDNRIKSMEYSQVNTASDSLGISQLLQENRDIEVDAQDGGRKEKKSAKKVKKVKSVKSSQSARSLRSSQSARSSNRSDVSRKVNEASEIHNEVVTMITKMLPSMGNYDNEDARYVKAGLYEKVKKEYPNLSNLQRAHKLKEMTTDDEIKKIIKILPKLKELVTKAREQKKMEKENSSKSVNSDDVKKVKSSKKETKTKTKKETKTKKA